MALTEKLTAVADAIRGKTGKSETLTLDQMATEIAGIEVGGGGFSFEQIATPDGVAIDNLDLDFNITRSYAFHENKGIKKVTLHPGFKGNYSTAITNLFSKSAVEEIDCVDFEPIQGVPGDYYCLNPSMFANCTKLTSAKLGVFAIAGEGFMGCTKLKIVDTSCPMLSTDNGFKNCAAFDTFILRSTTLVPLNKASTYWAFMFNGTPFDDNPVGSGGTVYVPAALISEYQKATNWSTLYAAGTCNFVAIEGSEYE